MLHPKYGVVQVTISRPAATSSSTGRRCCTAPTCRSCSVRPGETLPISAYIGYDAVVGQVFEDPGTYRIRADVHRSRRVGGHLRHDDRAGVERGRGDEDGAVADLMLGDGRRHGHDPARQRTRRSLADGMAAMQEIAEEHADSPDAPCTRGWRWA